MYVILCVCVCVMVFRFLLILHTGRLIARGIARVLCAIWGRRGKEEA